MVVSKALSFAEADTVNNARVVERVRDNCILAVHNSLEETRVGVETTWVQNAVFSLVPLCNCLLQLLVDVLGAADEANT